MMDTTQGVMRISDKIPSLDGIRALAVLLVFFAHSGLEHLVPGGLGVSIFFVLSGFLITTLLRVEFQQRGSIHLRQFYLRRLLRLLPPLLVVVAATLLLSSGSFIDGRYTLEGLFATMFYVGNYFVIAHDFHGMPAGMGVVWSLAIEEHFYLIYPLIAGAILRIRSANQCAVILVLICAAFLAWRCWLALNDGSVNHLMMSTDTRADSILIGCVLAIRFNPWLNADARRSVTTDMLWCALCFIVLLATLLYQDGLFRLTARYTAQSIAIAGLINVAVARPGWIVFRALNARTMVYLGSISYTIYLSHQVILLGVAKQWPDMAWLPLTLCGAVVTWLFAEAMRRWIEAPTGRMRARLHGRTNAADPPTASSRLGTP